MKSLVDALAIVGVDVARRALITRAEEGVMDSYLRGELAGLARAMSYVTGEDIDDIESAWIKLGSLHFTVPDSQRQ